MLSHGSKLFSIDIDFFFLAITENVMWHVWVSYPEVPAQTRFISYPSWFIVLWNIFIFQGFFFCLFVWTTIFGCFPIFFKGFPVIICFFPPPVFLKRLMKFCYSLVISTISSNIHLAKFRWSRKILLYSRVL